MKPRTAIFQIFPLVCLVAHAQEAPPAAAMKYHNALLKNPHNTTLFSRFHDAWIDEQALDSLSAFLKTRAGGGDGADLTILALHQLRRGQEDDALATLTEAVRLRPEDPNLAMERAKILLRRLDFGPAREHLDSVAEADDETLAIEAVKLIGKSHLREGNPAAASTAWEKLLEKHPGNEDILEDLVELAAASQQYPKAVEYSESLIKATSDPFKKAQRKIRLGELLADSGENEKAVDLWSATLADTGEGSWLESEIIARIAVSYRRQDRIDSLEKELGELVATHPRRLLVHRELAKLEAASGNLDSAIGRFREVLRRSPGQADLREEFIRLLIDGERFDDATAELEKMIALSPQDPELPLRMADLAHREARADLDRKENSPPPPSTLANLKKALALLPPGEPSGIRIATLMLQYGFPKEGEALLTSLSSAEDATSAPAEALAAEYTRTDRKDQALAIFKEVAKSPESETLLRATSSILTLGHPETAFEILTTRLPEFSDRPSHLTALAKAALAAKKPAEAIDPVIRLVRLSSLHQEILDNTRLATSVISAAEKTKEQIDALEARDNRNSPETCLLAALLDSQSNLPAADALFAETSDPELLRFHSSLLSQRGDFPAAIASLRLLEDTPEGNKASYFKELSELQLRAGLTDECLATIEQWKIAAPTAKTPWTIETNLLKNSGKIQEAVETTRRALTRFSDDEDLSASLAELHKQSGDFNEAERIFWQLYDKAPDPIAQSRWAARLSDLARNTGTTAELKEKFLERSRSNSRSLGPVLALVELARIENDRDAIRAYLSQALRIKPGDIDVRLQLAEAESQSGNREDQIAVLSEGTSNDPTGRIRTALAQAHITNGDVMKGMRMLRSLAGERASDPRTVESAAISLANGGMISEAIRYLKESLPDGGDWRSSFLLASLLDTDGREAEAARILITLLDAEKEIPSLVQNPNANHGYYHGSGYHHHRGIFIPVFQNQNTQPDSEIRVDQLLSTLMQVKSLRDPRRGRNNFHLPSTPQEVRLHSLVTLAILASSEDPETSSLIAAADIDHMPFLADACGLVDYRGGDYLELLEKHPTQPGLLDYVIRSGYLRKLTPENSEFLKRILTEADLDHNTRFSIANLLLNADPETPDNWDTLLSVASTAIAKDPQNSRAVCQGVYQLLASGNKSLTPDRRDKIKEILLAYLETDKSPESQADTLRLNIIAAAGTTEQWIEAFNTSIATYRAGEEERRESMAKSMSWHFAQLNFAFPNINSLPFTSVPSHYLQYIVHEPNQRAQPHVMVASDLLAKIGLYESPIVQAWVAYRAQDDDAKAKYLSATPPEAEKTDFLILRIGLACDSEKYPEACHLLTDLITSENQNPWVKRWAHSSLVAIAEKIPAEERKEFHEALRSALTALAPDKNSQIPPQHQNPWASHGNLHHYQTQALSQLSQKAKLFGFEDLAESFAQSMPTIPNRHTPNFPTVTVSRPALIAPSRPSSSSRRSNPTNPYDRFQIFAKEQKNAAAARELLIWIRQQTANRASVSDALSRFEKLITDEIRAEVLAMSDPGDDPGITKRLEHARICFALGENEKGLTILRQLAKDRPFDPAIGTELAFALPAAEVDEAAELLARFANSNDSNQIAEIHINQILRSRNREAHPHLFDLISKFLESSDSTANDPQTLNWVNSCASHMFSDRWLSIPSSDPKKPDEKANAEIARRTDIAKRTALSMLRHPSLAEYGFRLINSSKIEKSPEDLDAWARAAILAGSRFDSVYNRPNVNLPDDKSAANHLVMRLSISTNPEIIIPPEFLTAVGKLNPHTPVLLKFLSSPPTTPKLEKLWDSGAMTENDNDLNVVILRQAALDRATSLPGAHRLFIDRAIDHPATGNARPNLLLLNAALQCCSSLDEKGVREVCTAISKAILGDSNNPYAINNFQNILGNFNTDPRTFARVIRAFDSPETPISGNNRLQTAIQNTKISTPGEAVELLAEMGFLEPASSWKPLAVRTVKHDQISGQPTQIIERNDLSELVTNSLNRNIKRPEIIEALKKRRPVTFGSLLTAAWFTNGIERENLATGAFEHAAPVLKKSPPERLDDFALFIHLLPKESITKLPAHLGEKAREEREEKISQLLKNAEQRLEQQRNYPGNDPLSYIRGEISQLAELDLGKAVELFLKADRMGSASVNRINQQDESLHQTLSHLNSSRGGGVDSALRFYLAIRNSPRSNRFGISAGLNDESFLTTLGNLSTRQYAATEPRDSQTWQHTWAAAMSLPEELHEIGLAAAICSNLHYTGLSDTKNERENLKNLKSLDKKVRDFAITCSAIRGWQNDDKKARALTATSFLALLADPAFSPDSRTQIALTAAAKHPAILTDPSIAKAIAEIFSEHCSQDRSAVDGVSLAVVMSIARSKATGPALDHLKTIHSAFWQNADSPKAGGHLPIPNHTAEPLFQTAIAVGDDDIGKRLFPFFRDSFVGNVDTILKLISEEKFFYAEALLAAEDTEYRINTSLRYTPDLDKKLSAFRASGANPARLLRLECQLLKLRDPNGRSPSEAFTTERRKRLAANYLQNPPDDLQTRLEALHALATSNDPTPAQLDSEITKLAKSLNPVEVLRQGASDYHDRFERNLAPLRWEIICKAAAISLRDGNPVPFGIIGRSLAEEHGKPENSTNSFLRSAHVHLEKHSLPMTCLLISGNQSEVLGKLIEPLSTLATSISQTENFNSSFLISTLAHLQFITCWDGKPELFSQLVSAEEFQAQALIRTFTENRNFTFAVALQRSGNTSSFGPDPKSFLHATLTRPSVTHLLATTEFIFRGSIHPELDEEFKKLSETPPESFSPGGRALLHFKRAHDLKKEGGDATTPLRACIASVPDGKAWNDLRTAAKCDLARIQLTEMDKSAEAAKLLQSIPEDEVSPTFKALHQRLLASLPKEIELPE